MLSFINRYNRYVSLGFEWEISTSNDQHESPTAIANALDNFHDIFKKKEIKKSPKRLILLCHLTAYLNV